MNTGELLERAILENPEEDIVRLVFADWCQENKMEELGEELRRDKFLVNLALSNKWTVLEAWVKRFYTN